MKNKNRLSGLILIALFSITNALGQENKYYLGVGPGSSHFNFNETEIVGSFGSLSSASSFSDTTTSLNMFGGIQLDEYLALEMELIDSGDIVALDAGRSTKLFNVGTLAITAVLSKQISKSTRLFTKLGVHLWDIYEPFGDLDTIDSATDLTYGLGADINIYGDPSRQLRVQWNYYEYDEIFIEDSETLTINLLAWL